MRFLLLTQGTLLSSKLHIHSSLRLAAHPGHVCVVKVQHDWQPTIYYTTVDFNVTKGNLKTCLL